jgi:ribose-phosphate pyrophosphokinase
MENLYREVHRYEYTASFSPIFWGTFKDGYPDTMFEHPEHIKNSDMYFLASFEKPEDIFKQLSVLYALPHYGAKSLTVFLPYFPTATMERVDHPGQIATAKTLMRMLNAIPACHGTGPAKLVIYDIHSLAVQHFHGDGIIIELKSAIPLLLERLKQLDKKYIFAFPDEGARKRFHTFFPGKCIICTKDENRIVTIKEGHHAVDGADIVIIDDMVRKGDTLISCKDVLKKYGAKSVSAYVTHGVFTERSWIKFEETGFDRFWVTDSCVPERILSDEGINVPPFELISLSGDIASEIKRG